MTANNRVNLPQDMCECHIPNRVDGSVGCQYCLGNLPPKALKATHWINPWEDAIPVPIEELAECHAHLGGTYRNMNGDAFPLTKETILEHWGNAGEKLDAYVLPCVSGYHSIGIRYGAEGSEYLSPAGDKEKVQALLNKYT
jgi:hypothetical protein